MAIDTGKTTGARTGEQYLEGLRGDEREVWLEGEKVTDPSAHPKLEGAAQSLARALRPAARASRRPSSWTRRTLGSPST